MTIDLNSIFYISCTGTPSKKKLYGKSTEFSSEVVDKLISYTHPNEVSVRVQGTCARSILSLPPFSHLITLASLKTLLVHRLVRLIPDGTRTAGPTLSARRTLCTPKTFPTTTTVTLMVLFGGNVTVDCNVVVRECTHD